ncbi:hypothetical protein Neosp_000759 [[Neocosmospora] mangrovei]
MPGTDLEADCAQNIALLYYLGQVASHPHKNLTRPQEADVGWTISLNDEKHLTTTLGLLSGIKDDIRNVTAVCVEETRHGLVVMVAANTKGPGPVSPYLQWVKEGFDSVFSLLKDASRCSREKLESDVFGAMVSMCRWRILSRIRMINPENKPTFQKLLGEINSAIEKSPQRADRTNFIALSNQLMSELDKYQATFTPPIGGTWASTRDEDLESIVKVCYEFSEMPTVGTILLKDMNGMKPRVGPSTCEGVLNMIRKVGNYKRAATTLVKLARRYECIRQTNTLSVVLDSSTLAQHPPAQRPSLPAMLDKLKAHHGTSWNTARVVRDLSDYFGGESRYKSQIDPLMRRPRVHAEMQLIWYLDRRKSPTPPRVIASNKDACYLCNAFIAFHGKYSIPRTHGRIYPGWRLPSSGLQDVKKGFTLELERLAVAKINRIIQEGTERINCPLESTVPSAAVSGLSILTQQAEALRETEGGSDSDETVVPQHGTEISCPQEQQQELPLYGRIPTVQNGSQREEEAAPSHNEVESSAEFRPPPKLTSSPIPSPELPVDSSPESLSGSSPRPLSLSGPFSESLSTKELEQAPADEYKDAGRYSTPKAQDFQSSENPHHSTVETDTNSSPSVGSRLSKMVSPKTYETRLSSMSTPASLGKNPYKENEVGDEDAWRQVEKGRREVVTLPNSLELFVEYTTGPSSRSNHLRFKARRLSEDEAKAALKEGITVHDLTNLGYEEVKVKSSGGIMMRVDNQIFVAHLDEFVPPTNVT